MYLHISGLVITGAPDVQYDKAQIPSDRAPHVRIWFRLLQGVPLGQDPSGRRWMNTWQLTVDIWWPDTETETTASTSSFYDVDLAFDDYMQAIKCLSLPLLDFTVPATPVAVPGYAIRMSDDPQVSHPESPGYARRQIILTGRIIALQQ